MTSAKSFFNWIKEAERGHLTAFLSWSAFCIYCIIKITVLSVDTEYTFFGIGSTELLYICTGLGVALGFTEFFYLLQPKKLALYYSLPVTKTCIFWTRYLHGLFHFLLPLSLSMAVLSIYQSSVDLHILSIYSVLHLQEYLGLCRRFSSVVPHCHLFCRSMRRPHSCRTSIYRIFMLFSPSDKSCISAAVSKLLSDIL